MRQSEDGPIPNSRDRFTAGNSSTKGPTAPAPSSVVFVESYPQVIAGQQRTLLSLLETWSENEIPAAVLVPGEGPYVDELKSRKADVWVVPQPKQLGRYGGAVYRDGLIAKLKTRAQALGYIRTLRRFLREKKVQGVFCNDMRGILTVGISARSLGVPVMTWDKLDKPHGWLDSLELPLLQRTAVISEAVLTKFPKWQVQWFRNRIELVPNGADLARFDSAQSMRAAFGFGEQDIVIGIVGTVCDRKGHDRVLSVLPQLLERVPQAVLAVVGSWDDDIEHQRFYETLPNRDHPRVRFFGACPPDEMPGIMKSLDILAVPSRHEGMGQVVAEAMACRVPVAGARAGGIPEIVVDGETGLLFDGDDPQSVQDAIIALCESQELRVRMGDAGRTRAEKHFNRPQQMRRICQLFRELIN